MTIHRLAFLLVIISALSCSDGQPEEVQQREALIEEHTNSITLSTDIEWEQLNPARGDQSPQAGTIWGDRKGTVATGFLAKFVDGFSSPPHIHNVTYRAVVVSGLVHNDDPAAEKMWMPAGSFWTQPAGEAHITAVKGQENIAYVEIDEGPYLVQPIEEAYDNGERPVNIDASNVVWSKTSTTGVRTAYLWGDPLSGGTYGAFLKLPVGYSGRLYTDGEEMRGIVITGTIDFEMPNDSGHHLLDPGSSFSSMGKAVHTVTSKEADCLIYIRTNGAIRIDSPEIK